LGAHSGRAGACGAGRRRVRGWARHRSKRCPSESACAEQPRSPVRPYDAVDARPCRRHRVDAEPHGRCDLDEEPLEPVAVDAGSLRQHQVDADPPHPMAVDADPHTGHRMDARPLGSVDRVAVEHDGVWRLLRIRRGLERVRHRVELRAVVLSARRAELPHRGESTSAAKNSRTISSSLESRMMSMRRVSSLIGITLRSKCAADEGFPVRSPSSAGRMQLAVGENAQEGSRRTESVQVLLA